MARKQLRGTAQLLGLIWLGACSVQDLKFVPDSELEMMGEGDTSSGATDSAGGSDSKAGGSTKAGSGTGGSGTGGSGTGGKATGGSNTGGTSSAGNQNLAGMNVGGSAPVAGMGGMPEPTCPAARAVKDQPIIDTFEDGNPGLPMPVQMYGGRSGGWYVVSDDQSPLAMLMPPANPNMPPNPANPGFNSMYALRLSGGGFRGWGASIATNLVNIPNRAWPCPYDVSAHQGVRFYVRGNVGDNIVRFGLTTQETTSIENGGLCDSKRQKCFDVFSYEFPPPAMWQQISIPFAKLQQLNGGVMDLNLTHVFGVEFAVHGAGSTPGGQCPDQTCQFDFWIDNLEFY